MASKALYQASPRRLKPLYLDRLCALLEETARLDALPLEAVVAQLAALEAGELLALTRHLRLRWPSVLCRWTQRSCGSCGSACGSG